jgi:hypothetical protein
MFPKRKTFNPKRSIATDPGHEDLVRWRDFVSYGGNSEHKRNPGDFDLTPPSNPRPDKTLCDGAAISSRAEALRLLREGIRRGLVSVQMRNGFPQNIWAVTEAGIPLEGQLENPGNGTYHGYPMPEADPFRSKVIDRWNAHED